MHRIPAALLALLLIPAAASAIRAAPEPVKSEPVIPLVHAPDDPGPDGIEESGASTNQDNSGWRKIFQ